MIEQKKIEDLIKKLRQEARDIADIDPGACFGLIKAARDLEKLLK